MRAVRSADGGRPAVGGQMKISFRTKLIGSFLFVIVSMGGVGAAVGAWMIGEPFVRQAQARVGRDIRTARHAYDAEVAAVADRVRLTALQDRLREALRLRDAIGAARVLREVREREALDMLAVVDMAGTVLARSREGAAVGDSLANHPAFRIAAATGAVSAGTFVVPAEELALEDAALTDSARVELVETPMAKPTTRKVETSGMAIGAAAPIADPNGRPLGMLIGGRLLNRHDDLVDRIRDTLYGDETYEGRSIGTATIFLGDVRVATNVPDGRGGRAIGSRIQAEVGADVLDRGRPWVGRAFAASAWYLAAYQPIEDLDGKVLGVLYVGVVEGKFLQMRRRTEVAFLVVTVGGILLAAAIAYAISRSVQRPIRRLVAASQAVSTGNFEYEVPERSSDEFGRLERAFNAMTAAIRERDRRLKEHAELKTSTVLMQTDRLASLGRLVAGVVHEINNPLSGILTLLKLLRRVIDEERIDFAQIGSFRSHIDLAQSETVRCSRIVGRLLDFSRQSKLELAEFDVNELLSRTLAIVEHQLAIGDIAVVRRLDPGLPRMRMDVGKIQQVVMNMVINAQEAMPDGGTLRISTSFSAERRMIVVEIGDAGVGISPENLSRIFDPFFTTKESKGLGLGLSVAYGIVREHGGDIEVESEVGRGTVFRVYLPVAAGTDSGAGAAAGGAERGAE